MSMTRLERRIAKLEADEEKLHEQLAEAAADYAKAAELDRQLNLNESVLRTKLMRPEVH